MGKKRPAFLKEKMKSFSWYRIWILLIVLIVIVAGTATGVLAYERSYQDRVYPGVHLGNVPIGGLDEEGLRLFLFDIQDKLLNDGIRFTFDEELDELILYPTAFDGDTIEFVELDVEKEVDALLHYGKRGNIFSRAIKTLKSRFAKGSVSLKHITVYEDAITDTLKDYVKDVDTKATNAGVDIESVDPLVYTITSSTPGVEFKYDNIVDEIYRSWGELQTPEITIEKEVTEPEVLESDVEKIADRLGVVLEHNGITLTYTDPHTKRDSAWSLPSNVIYDWLEVQKQEENGAGFGINKEEIIAYLEGEVEEIVNIEAKDAKFEVQDGKVTSFQGSRPGIQLKKEETYDNINNAMLQRTWHDEGIVTSIEVKTEVTEPQVKTGDVNDVGITEVLGTGYSAFKGSPPNRISNIRNAVIKLNGLLVEPGEEFSTVVSTKPFTIAGGYLPEKVIIGDKIEDALGGGLCQISTTIFRAVMNSGLEITERRNHRFAVHYYNIKGKPGVDATIFDSHPDFRFVNDTNHAILIQAELNEYTEELFFTFWGTSDGRKGSFTDPVVNRWIPHGPTQYVETDELPPGTTKCQGAYTGADTSFVYSIERPNGEDDEEIYFSHYRPLANICLVGVEPKEQREVCDESGECVTIDIEETEKSEE
ncbi:MAG: hypothetical protein HOJ29_03095 [Candidatus Magasanikbacteria bacterium]|nr:hypothetical protein [Candidatus Magasanikbacteria bacterium]MBT6253365.1 hypothetical protein [Candidatus Magasanikbacteria bacterium]MBT6334953.1 hypothetical protein [Candidatus Magasanikbacteria bacterium]